MAGFKGFRRFKGEGIALAGDKYIISLREMEKQTTALAGEGKTSKPRLRRAGNAPLSPPTAVLPPEGEVLAMLCSEQLKLALRDK